MMRPVTWHEAVPLVGRRAVGFELAHEARNSDSFHDRDAAAMNAARLAHLDTLGIDWRGRRVLDVGSGPGLLAGHLVERGAHVTCVDGRADLLEEARRRVPSIETVVADVQRDPLLPIGRFDVVFAYGLLYHLAEPLRAIRNFVAVCDDLLLLETITLDHGLPLVQLVDEPAQANQAVDGLACRPTPSWVALALERSGMGMVYGTTGEPVYRDFGAPALGDLQWERDGANLRRVFVAARAPVGFPGVVTLTEGQRRSPAQLALAVGDGATEPALDLARREPTAVVYCLCADAAEAEALNGRLPNVHAWPLAAAADGLGAFCDSLGLRTVSRLLVDEKLAGEDVLEALADRASSLDELMVVGRGDGDPAVPAGLVVALEGAGLERRSADAGTVRYRRPASGGGTRPLSFEQAWPGDDAVVEHGDGTLHVVTPEQPWSYAAIVPLEGLEPDGVAVRVTLQVLDGRIGLALMRSLSDLSLEVPIDASPGEQVIELPFAVVRDAHDLLVRNHAGAGSARCRLTKLELLTG
jgi:SAM-dependent methyltransferase